MAVIEETFGPRKYELIRDRIAEIVADELESQSTKNSDPNLDAKVWLERLVPMSQQELPAVNVFAAEGKFERFTTESQTGEYTFALDVFTRGATEGSTAAQRGDLISSKKMMRLVGVLQAVLSHWKYCKLGFAENFIDRVEVQNFKLMEPVKAADNSNVSKGRIVLFVKAEETLDPKTPNLIDGYDTAVKLYETEFGYVYSGTNPPIVPPICTFDTTIYGSFAAGDDLMVPFLVDSDSAGTYDEIFSDPDSGSITISVNGSAFAAFSPGLVLVDTDILIVKRSGVALDGWYKLKGNY